MIAGIAAAGLGIAHGLALEVRARHVIELEVVFQAEQLAQPILQETSNASLCGNSESNARYRRCSLIFSGGTPSRSARALWV